MKVLCNPSEREELNSHAWAEIIQSSDNGIQAIWRTKDNPMRKEQKFFVAWHHGMAPHGTAWGQNMEPWNVCIGARSRRRHGPPPRMARVKTIAIGARYCILLLA